MRKYFFPILITLSALAISISAAYYSVFGLSKLFSGAGVAIIIMASSLEFSKLVVASLLHQYWKSLNFLIKTYLSIALIVLMAITSAGIYGFLTSAYQQTYTKSQIAQGEINLLENKKVFIQEDITRLDEQVDIKKERISTLTELRTTQETRLDSLYTNHYFSKAKSTEQIIADANLEIKQTTKAMDSLLLNISTLNDSISNINISVLELNNSNEAAAELGPLKYLAELTDKPMDQVINWYMLLIIFVFDPLAIALVIVANFSIKLLFKKEPEYPQQNEYKIYKDKVEIITPVKEESPKIENLFPQTDPDLHIDKINPKLSQLKKSIINSQPNPRFNELMRDMADLENTINPPNNKNTKTY